MIIRVKTFFILFLLLLFALNALAQPTEQKDNGAQTIDRIVAVVNGEVITQIDLERALATIEAEYRTMYLDPQEFAEKFKSVKKNIINQMIEEKLILSEAKRFNIQVEEDKIDERLEQLRKNFPSAERFEQALENQDLTLKDLRERFRDQEVMKKAVNYFVNLGIKIDPAEIREFYESRKSELAHPEQALVKSILIKVEGEQDEYIALQKAKTVLERLKKGDNFTELAGAYSQGINAQEGGNLGWFTKGQLMEEIDAAIFNLVPGEFTEVIRTPQGYRIFMLEEKRPRQLLSFSEAQDEINEILYNQKFSEAFKSWMGKLRKDAYISIKEQD